MSETIPGLIHLKPYSELTIGEFDTGYAERREDGIWAICGEGFCIWEVKVPNIHAAPKALKGHKRHKRAPEAIDTDPAT